MKGKVALITGGSKGIGLGIAHALHQQGVKIALTSRSKDAAESAAKSVASDALGLEADVRNRASMDAAVAATVSAFGQIDYVIANAGLGHFASIEDLTEEQWHDTIDTNLTGVFYTIKASLEELKKSKGYIITISSLAGTNFFPTASAYNASKFGLTGFTQAVMLDLRDHGINVSTIMPGSVATHFNNHEPSDADAWKIQPEDIGEIVVDLFKMNPRTLPSKIEVRPSRPNK
ncbi:SDR family oxidoreductase [Phaeocystidibacter marisrubri]|uniref:SDR family oxidoreductase n=1 Tax=Phaeocystidibacter marisrubri TaxID=1577780 RepID=A0A6L3ZHX2_9FLAO|nr:SDR family oxidoreductase [Phaeocystidibacter marisrubri]KAB2816619.1 SDR family oxidoreductase [Phaeocystidibacter marisrubri]GGH69981.1 short-chain dehydrogenase [Phaeocystidibacter marisrubri]